MIKSLQFRKLCRVKDESTEEWMGCLCMVEAECGCKEIDRQLRKQFIHGLNDKVMLDEIIRELTSKTSSQQMTSEDVLAWAKGVEVQRVQALILNDITETKTFDKVEKEPESKNTQGGEANVAMLHAGTVGEVMHPDNAQHMGKCVPHAARWDTLGRYAGAKETAQCMKWK